MANNTPLEKTSASLFDSIKMESPSMPDENRAGELCSGGRLSAWAILSLVLSVFGFLSLVWLGCVVFSILAAFSAIVAFFLMARSGGELTGTKFAAIGLALACASGVAGPVSAAVYEREFDRQADAFIRAWFDAASSGNPALAHQMTEVYWQRAVFVTPDDVKAYWLRSMRGEEDQHYGVHTFLSNPTLLTITQLRDRITFSYYMTKATLINNSTEQTHRVYAVTVAPETPDGKPQTFFLEFLVERAMRRTPQGERLVGWMWHLSDLIPAKLDASGLPAAD